MACASTISACSGSCGRGTARRAPSLCKIRRRHVRTTDSEHGLPVYPNLYRDEVPREPDRVWVADLTYIRIPAEFVYLAVLLDACSRKVVGWGLSGQPVDPRGAPGRHRFPQAITGVHSPLRPWRAVCLDEVRETPGRAQLPDQHGSEG